MGSRVAREHGVVVGALGRGGVRERGRRARGRGDEQPIAVDVVVITAKVAGACQLSTGAAAVGVAAVTLLGALTALESTSTETGVESAKWLAPS